MPDQPARPQPFNLAAPVLAAGTRRPDKTALDLLGPEGAERWSFARLIAAIRGTATGLRRMGLAPGDRILLRLGNGVAFPVAHLGAIAAGLVPIVEANLRAFAEGRLAAYKVPRPFVRMTHLPRGANNKLLRRKLRHDWENSHDQA